MKSPLPLLLGCVAFVSWAPSRHRHVPRRAVKGYFAIRDLLVLERQDSDVEAFHAAERERWRRVYDEEYVETKQEFYPGDRVEALKRLDSEVFRRRFEVFRGSSVAIQGPGRGRGWGVGDLGREREQGDPERGGDEGRGGPLRLR